MVMYQQEIRYECHDIISDDVGLFTHFREKEIPDGYKMAAGDHSYALSLLMPCPWSRWLLSEAMVLSTRYNISISTLAGDGCAHCQFRQN